MGKGRKNKAKGIAFQKGIAFYIETFALFAVFAAAAVVLARGFVLAGKLSRDARALSNAVHLAENAAEMASASESGEMLFGLLNENGNVGEIEEGVYRARYDADMLPSADGIYSVDVSWNKEEGRLVKCAISVYQNGEAEPLYALDLTLYDKAAAIP